MKDHEIGEYTGCTHGENGTRKYGCIPCALQWHTERQVDFALRAEHHLTMIRRLEDLQIARNLDAHDKGEPKP